VEEFPPRPHHHVTASKVSSLPIEVREIARPRRPCQVSARAKGWYPVVQPLILKLLSGGWAAMAWPGSSVFTAAVIALIVFIAGPAHAETSATPFSPIFSGQKPALGPEGMQLAQSCPAGTTLYRGRCYPFGTEFCLSGVTCAPGTRCCGTNCCPNVGNNQCVAPGYCIPWGAQHCGGGTYCTNGVCCGGGCCPPGTRCVGGGRCSR
jgi:hypothetical protein